MINVFSPGSGQGTVVQIQEVEPCNTVNMLSPKHNNNDFIIYN
jgi:hypothetical protein